MMMYRVESHTQTQNMKPSTKLSYALEMVADMMSKQSSNPLDVCTVYFLKLNAI